MERIESLIKRLQEQVSQQAEPSQMQMTLELIQSELNQMQSGKAKVLGTSKVAVVLPKRNAPVHSTEKIEANEIRETGADSTTYYKPKHRPDGQLDLYFDPLIETPTLSHQEGVMEINDRAMGDKQSLNDKLRENKTEIMHVLKDSPIRDLRKGIGINDRFLFISDLFRGDESMYERSIKTINSFNIYAEAEYWMNRELKVKLGWDETRDNVKYFYHLVKRRFS
jgi:hypothetical protein